MSTATTAALAPDLRMTVMRLARRMRHQRADHGLVYGQLSVLATLERHGAMSAGALAAYEKVRPPSMTKIIAGLLELRLVTRTPSPDDRRQVVLDTTAAARALLREDRRRRDEWLAGRLAALDADDRRALERVLPVLVEIAAS